MKYLFFILAICMTMPAYAANERIDPQNYICAELIALNTDGQPPVFEGLQIDGYASAKDGSTIADPTTLQDMLIEVSRICETKPTAKVLKQWRKARKNHPVADDGIWRVDQVTCGKYAENPDDGSGFVIWLDGYNRGLSKAKESIFDTQDKLDKFLEICKGSPNRLMIDVLKENVNE